MNIFGIGLPEMALITIVALLVFGPKKLPEIGRSVAKTLRSFQDASKEFENEFKKEAASIEKSLSMNAQIEHSSEAKPTKEIEAEIKEAERKEAERKEVENVSVSETDKIG